MCSVNRLQFKTELVSHILSTSFLSNVILWRNLCPTLTVYIWLWHDCTMHNLLTTVKWPLVSVPAVSILCASFSVSADIVLLLYTFVSISGGLIADGAVATSITGLWKTQGDSSSCCGQFVTEYSKVLIHSFLHSLTHTDTLHFEPYYISEYYYCSVWTLIFLSFLFYTTVYTNTDMTARQISFLLVWADERISQHLRALQ